LSIEYRDSTSKEPRCLGLVGGLGPGATVYYYRGLLAAHEVERRTPRLLIAHADVERVRHFLDNNDRAGLARYLAGFVSGLAAGGAELTAIVAITPHICASELTTISPLPLIDIASAVAEEIQTRNYKCVALLGTRFTVASRMFGRLGVDVVMPKPYEIDQIHNVYMDVLHERSTPMQIDGLRQVARKLIERDGAEAVLLAGTDLSMVLNENNAGFPTIDCAAAHIKAIMKRLLDVRFGSLADIRTAQGHVRFAPNSDRKSGHPQ
jgi:aspartate racemase